MSTTNQSSLAGRTAVITGASSGIGTAVARRLHGMGAQVALAARSLDKLDALAAELGARAIAIELDVSDEASVRAAFEAVRERCGEVDLLVNNAGFGRFETVAESSVESLRQMMDVNYFGVALCTKAVLPSMLARRSGHIVNVASIAGKLGTAKSAGYSATKHAVLGFTNALRQELHGTGVRVTAVNPGPVRTAFFDIADPSGGYVRNVNRMMVTPERVADALVAGALRGKAEVSVPGWFGFAASAGQALPVSLVNAIAVRFLKLK
ncbi:SDR family oxidoreductase [Paenibacillus sp. TRM 82003]|nr:SDR family oxidoreductase [Paenibacillus sp. TRM 82003]